MNSFLNEWWDKTYNSKTERLTLHVLLWVLYLSFLSITAYEHLQWGYSVRNNALWLVWFCPVYLVLVYYLGLYIAYANFRKRMFIRACIGVVITFVIYWQIDILFSYFQLLMLKAENIPIKHQSIGNFDVFYIQHVESVFSIMHALFNFALYLFVPVSYKFFRDTQRSIKKMRELKERNVQLELNLIKSQMNPHFLLNTLNNIFGYTLNGTRQQIGNMILNLSDFLKFSLYECNSEFVTIEKEIRLMENFMKLEAVRSEFINTNVDVDVDQYSCSIPPFMLFTLVENAFKHGTFNLVKPTVINVKLRLKAQHLYFRVENDFIQGGDNIGGIGLAALYKKIEYYYGPAASLTSVVENGRYIAELKIFNICEN